MTATLTEAPFTYAWAQTTGAAHKERGVPCEDTMGLTIIKDKQGTAWLISAAADGAGSAECAAEASRIAAESFIEAAAETLLRNEATNLDLLMRSSFVYARTILEFVAEYAGRSLDDYHTTLLACVTCGTRSAFLQIGDGVIIVREAGGDSWKAVFPPQNGEERHFTYFLTQPDAFHLVQVMTSDRPLTHVALITDGLQDILLHPETLAVRSALLDKLASGLSATEASGDAKSVSSGLNSVLNSTAFRRMTGDDTSLLAVQLTDPV